MTDFSEGCVQPRMSGIRIEGNRIALREWRVSDADAMHRLMGDREVTRFLTWGPLSRRDSLRRLEGFIKDQDCCNRRETFRERLRKFAIAIFRPRTASGPKPSWPLENVCEAGCSSVRVRFYLAIELKASERVIGETGFQWTAEEEREGEIGYFLEREFWRNGYASEAALLVIDFAFRMLGARRIRAACDTHNSASERVMQNCGLCLDPTRCLKGSLVYVATRDSWSKNSERV
jgi:RimJ/RimL family protein N-acetyltransferase